MAIGAQLFPASKRQQLPAIEGKSLAGQALALRSLTGHGVLVVNVWASWCTSCREESAALASFSATTAPATARFVGIDEQDVAGKARSFVAATGMRYPQLSDPSGAALNRLTILPNYGIPSTLVVDRHGLMAARIIGPVTTGQLRKLVSQVAAES